MRLYTDIYLKKYVRYMCGLTVSGLLEALSDQNDNLTLPLYVWSVVVVFV